MLTSNSKVRSSVTSPVREAPRTRLKQQASLDDQYRKLVASGVDTTVALAYQTVAPLWLENVAISRHIVRTGKSDLRYLLPEVTSLAEALDLAEREWMLDPAQSRLPTAPSTRWHRKESPRRTFSGSSARHPESRSTGTLPKPFERSAYRRRSSSIR